MGSIDIWPTKSVLQKGGLPRGWSLTGGIIVVFMYHSMYTNAVMLFELIKYPVEMVQKTQ